MMCLIQLKSLSNHITEDLPEVEEELSVSTQTAQTAQLIIYYDEVLTQSARNYAFTNDTIWLDRYTETDPKLIAALNVVSELDEEDKEYFEKVDHANQELIKMEAESMSLVTAGKQQEAIQLLESEAYASQKAIYSQGIQDYLTKEQSEYEGASSEIDATLSSAITNLNMSVKHSIRDTLIVFILALVVSIALSIIIARNVIKPLNYLTASLQQIGKGKFDTQTLTTGPDELKKASEDVQKMTKELQMYQHKLLESEENKKKELESEVDKKTKQLQIMVKELDEKNKHLQDLDKAKSDFLNVVSHELKTPLTAIFAYLDIMDDSKKIFNKELLESFYAVRRNSDQLHALINNILEVSRIEAGRFELINTDMNIPQKINNIVKNLKPLADANENTMTVQIGKVPASMITDEQRFEEILNNLISNAIKFTEKGRITVSAQQKGDSLMVSVKDSGVGIPLNKVKNLFQTFYQVDATVSRKYGGTGLGLSITKKLVELQGGTIQVESVEGKGSTFTFTLPLKPKKK